MTDTVSSPPDEPDTKQLQEILAKHEAWRLGEPGGVRANLRGAHLRGANLRGAHLRGADLRGANLSEANLSEADLHGADLRGADLRGAHLRGANLHGANLSGANLHRANLWRANLRGADLWRADLHGADLSGANLRGADLRWANLTKANLTGAALTDATLFGAGLIKAILTGVIGLPIANDAPARLQAVAAEVLTWPETLDMDIWHSECGTAHCIAGLAIHQAGPKGAMLEAQYGPHLAGWLLLGDEAASHFYDTTEVALLWLQSVLNKES